MKRILLTGVGGFIGAHCLEYWLANTDWQILGIDSFRHKGTYSRIGEVKTRHLNHTLSLQDWGERVKIFNHDLSVPLDKQLVNQIVNRQIDGSYDKIDVVVNMAANSAVERSTQDPGDCLLNNYNIAINMLEFAREVEPDAFFQISTDEVYGECTNDAGHYEWDVICPSNPYAASKAAQEAVAIAYWRTYAVPVILTNTMNIIGEWQDVEKFLPKIVQFVATGQTMPIYADKKGDEWDIGSRVYLHAQNKADALKFIIENCPATLYNDGENQRPDRYNICGNDEYNNLELAQLVADIMNKKLEYVFIPSESARPGYDRRYMLDGSKLAKLGWKPPLSFRAGLERVVEFTLDNPHWLV